MWIQTRASSYIRHSQIKFYTPRLLINQSLGWSFFYWQLLIDRLIVDCLVDDRSLIIRDYWILWVYPSWRVILYVRISVPHVSSTVIFLGIPGGQVRNGCGTEGPKPRFSVHKYIHHKARYGIPSAHFDLGTVPNTAYRTAVCTVGTHLGRNP